MNSWDDLSIREKAEMMKVAIRNGITSLPDIKDAYNEFAEGGNLYGDGSYLSKAKSLIKRHEGWRSTPYKDAPKGKSWRSVGYGFNDSGFYERYPEGISKHYEKGITKAQAEQELDYYLGKAERTLRGIYGKHWDSFNDNQKAAIFDTYYQRPASVGKGSAFYNAVKSGRDATKYLGVSGYAGRNKDRQSVFGGGATPAVAENIEVTLPQEMSSQPMITAASDFTPMNPQVFGMQMPSYQNPVVVPEQPIIVMAEQPTPTPEQIERQRVLQERAEKRDALNRFSLLMSMTNPQQGNDMMGAIGMLAGLSNSYRSGGGIYIKPSHRGRFTELKERTGHSASWFKEHGTPAQKKMATFELNAAKWHGYGGNLYDGITEPSQQMDNSYTYYKPLENIFVDSEGNLRDSEVPRARGSILLPEVTAAYPDLKDMAGRYNIASNDAITVVNGRPVNMHLRKAVDEGAKKQAAWAQEHPYLNMVGIAAGAAPLVVATTPAVVGGGELAATALANPYVDAGITSAFAGHGLNHAINEGIDGLGDAAMTALEVAPLGRLAKPVYEGIVQPGMRWFNSALTSRPQYSPIIQRSVGTNITTGTSEETANAVERGRNTLLDWVKSPFYKARLEDEPLYRVADDVIADAGKMIEEVPIDISKTKLELDPSDMVNGVTKTRPAIQTQLPDGTTIADLNTGLDVSVASDLGKEADETALHELLHYMTANSKGEPISQAGERIIKKGWMEPTETHFDAINIIHKNRSKSWQDFIMDQNDLLLPQYDPVVKMVMEEPDKAISLLKKAGKTEADAKSAVQSLRARYSEWYDIQEQRAYLQQLFHTKIRPNLKNPNDAAEIEEYLSLHPEVLDDYPAYKHIQEVRPGSLKDYAKYFSAALGTIPFIPKLAKDDER